MNLGSRIVTVAILLYITLTAFYLSVSAKLNSDEHQFMASAFMVAEYNLHPYQDFPYFHMPNLVYVYAILFRLTDYPFLAARLFSGLCAVAICLVIFFVSRSLFPRNYHCLHLIIAVSTAVLLTNSPLFATAASRVWNHTPSTLFATLSFVFYGRGIRQVISWKYFLLSGFCLGFATNIRLSFAPLAIPFIVSMFLPPVRGLERRLPGILAFAVGGLLASTPAIYFLITHTEQFLFGNLGYAALNTLYREETGYRRAMTLGGKLTYLVEVLSQPGNLLIVGVAVFGILTVKVKHFREAMRSRVELTLLLLLLPFLFIGSLAPTPSWSQYFFAPTAFTILLAPYSLAHSKITRGRYVWVLPVILAAMLSFKYGAFPGTSASMASLFNPKSWYPVQLHERSTEIANIVVTTGRAGKVLTLAPLYAVEGRLPVYRQFVTGQFAWRVSHLMSPADRLRQSVVSPAEIESLLGQDRPVAILTETVREHLEEPFIRAASKLGYQQKQLSDGSTLWIP